MAASNERRRGIDRRQRERRARLAAIQEDHDELRRAIQQNIEHIARLEKEQLIQLVRIARIQQELDELKKSRP